jgi:hypothetical protein
MKKLKQFFLALLEGIQDAKKYKSDPSAYVDKAKKPL